MTSHFNALNAKRHALTLTLQIYNFYSRSFTCYFKQGACQAFISPATMSLSEEDSNESLLDTSLCQPDLTFGAGNPSIESDRDLNTTIVESIKLRKNLSQTFNEQLSTKKGSKNEDKGPSPDITSHSVAVKIAKYEQKSQEIPKTVAAPKQESFSVYLRMRPCEGESTIEILPGGQRIRTRAPATSNAYKVSRSGTDVLKEYEFAAVLGPDTSQKHTYEKTVQPYVPTLCHNGQSALIFCYGVTNAGKTYTVTGPDKALSKTANNTSSWGLVPRAVQEVLTTCQKRHKKNTDVQISYYEIYNEQVYDLLAPKGNTYLDAIATAKNITAKSIQTVEDGLECITLARRNRRSATNRVNEDSSRSHAICRIRVMYTDDPSREPGELWIVDLAGNERVKRTGGGRMHEATAINQSLMTLNQCLMALKTASEPGGTMMPWRNSKLTRLFASHWLGESAARTAMVVNVNPSVMDFDETQPVLNYASVARTVRVDPAAALLTSNKSSAVEYGLDGRRKRTNFVKKISKAIVEKLSPKRPQAKKRVIKATVAEPVAKKARVEEASDYPKAQPSSSQEKEIKRLQTHLRVERAECAYLKNCLKEVEAQLLSTESKLFGAEEEIRSKLAAEMEAQMNSMRQIYEAREDRLRQESQVELEQAQEQIACLQEQVAECEQEMLRMQKDAKKEEDPEEIPDDEGIDADVVNDVEEQVDSVGMDIEKEVEGKQDVEDAVDDDEDIQLAVDEDDAVLEEEEAVATESQSVGQEDDVDEEMENEETQPTEVDEDIKGEETQPSGLEEDAEREEEQEAEETQPSDESFVIDVEEAKEVDTSAAPTSDEDMVVESTDDTTIDEIQPSEELLNVSHVPTQAEIQFAKEANQTDDDSVGATKRKIDEVLERFPIHKKTKENVFDLSPIRPPSAAVKMAPEIVIDDDEDDDDDEVADLPKFSKKEKEPRRNSRRKSTRNKFKQDDRQPLQSSKQENKPEDLDHSVWLLPKKKPRRDPFSGAYARPKGRKPKGAEDWDESRGAWRKSILIERGI